MLKMSGKEGVIHWFRKGLRVTDQPALTKAIELASSTSSETKTLYPLYIVDGDTYQLRECSVLRARFLIECLNDLHKQLDQIVGNRLYVAYGDPNVILPSLWKEWNITDMTYDKEETLEPYSHQRDASINKMAVKEGIQIHPIATDTLFPLSDYDDKIDKANTMSSFQSVFTKMGPVPKPSPSLADASLLTPKKYKDTKNYMPLPTHPTEIPWPRNTPKKDLITIWDTRDCDKVLNQKGIVKGGESHALQQLQSAVTSNPEWVAQFSKPHTSPNSLKPSTCVISPYMSLGCLSPRMVWYTIADAIQKAPANVNKTKPPVSLHGQLLWREFNHCMARSSNLNSPGSWGQIKGNKYCRDIPWDVNIEYQQAWKDGSTGYPWIDACMVQLKQEGWIHHLGRHAVACFLTRGDLWQSWVAGAAYFESQLLDADYALNNFNWMWLSCSGFFYQYFRCYSPIAFGKKTDAHGQYIRKYLPQLSKLPTKYIYEPWKAPIAVQNEANIRIISRDKFNQLPPEEQPNYYPKPIVDHATVSKHNMSIMKQAYDHHKEIMSNENTKVTTKKRSTVKNSTTKNTTKKRKVQTKLK